MPSAFITVTPDCTTQLGGKGRIACDQNLDTFGVNGSSDPYLEGRVGISSIGCM